MDRASDPWLRQNSYLRLQFSSPNAYINHPHQEA
uniref:Uncharacterized protein n=1 Tax=Manihot esculenta TaxID=3983 RepID=A0A2C9V646_MANES